MESIVYRLEVDVALNILLIRCSGPMKIGRCREK